MGTKIRKKGEMKADQWIDQTKKSTLTRVSAAKKRERSVARLKAEFETLGVTGLAGDGEDAHFKRARSASRGPKAKRAKRDGIDPHATKGAVARSKSGIRGPLQWLVKLGKVTGGSRRRNLNISILAKGAWARLIGDKMLYLISPTSAYSLHVFYALQIIPAA